MKFDLITGMDTQAKGYGCYPDGDCHPGYECSPCGPCSPACHPPCNPADKCGPGTCNPDSY